MARNIEIKARIDDVSAMAAAVARLANEPPTEAIQDDTFFRCDAGRLKLRSFLDGTGKLILYRRANAPGPKESWYTVSETHQADTLRETLTHAYGRVGRVHKHRTVYLIGRTRVHLDIVEGLGHFLELEVVLTENESPDAGVREAHDLMARLGVKPEQLVDGAYLDLLGMRSSQ